MLIDVDAFRRVNDRHGEQAGDEALEAIARALTRRLRETDLVARLGADQFAVLLPHIDEEGLAVVAEGLTRVIAACGVDVGDEFLHPSASIGFTIVDEHVESAEQALLAADREMRAVRRAGAGARWLSCRRSPSRGGTLRRGEYAQPVQPNERLAVIDLGSNSFRLVVFQAGAGWWKRTDEIYEPVRIGEGLMATGRLGEQPMHRALATLDVFAHFCRAAGLDRGLGRRGRHECDPRRGERPRVPAARTRVPGVPDPRAQPRAGGALRLPGGGQLDDADATAACSTSAAARCSSCASSTG